MVLLALLPASALAAATHGRDSLKGTTKTQGDFNVAHRLTLEIGGVAVAGSPTIPGIQRALETIVRPPNHNPSISFAIDRTFSQADLALYDWYQGALNGKTERKSISVIYYNDDGAETERLNFFQCYPPNGRRPG